MSRYRRAIVLGPCIPPLAELPLRSMTSKREVGLEWLERELRVHGHCSKDLRIGVDAGVHFWKELNIPPHVAIGDWDSLSDIPGAVRSIKSTSNFSAPYLEFLKDAQVLTLPKKKDRSDLHYTLRVIQDTGIRQILCIGFTGGRPDHHLANLIEFGNMAGQPLMEKITSIGPEAGYYWVSPNTPLELDHPTEISVFAWNGKAEGVSLEGMEYKLKNAKLEPSSHGLSNRVLSAPSGSKARISVRRGLLLAVIPNVWPNSGLRSTCSGRRSGA